MSSASIPYATDEDIVLRASVDYLLLCPRDQKVAAGEDGAFLVSDLWTLTSATVDFQARGVTSGQVVQLKKSGSTLRPDGEGFVVVSTAPGAVTLRRKGQLIGAGEPPSPAGGLSGVEFLILTFGPQIDLASYELNHRFGIATNAPGGLSPAALSDPRELCDAVVLTVLSRQYFAMSRELGKAPDAPSDTFAAKAQVVKTELDDLLARLTLHWSASLGIDEISPPTTRFSTRMSR